MTPRVLFHVQHLWGVGHAVRIATIARACESDGIATTVITGGAPVDGLFDGLQRVVQLPPISARDETYAELVGAGGAPLDDALRARRRERILAVFVETRPDAVVIETFPFGRRKLAFELLPLIAAVEAARPRPLLVASLRDILVPPSKPARTAEALARAETFDAFLVHGDETFLRVEESLPELASLARKMTYTGYVVRETDAADPHGNENVISAGGGRAAFALARTALQAAALKKDDAVWRVVAGPHMPDAEWRTLLNDAGAAILERSNRNLAGLIARARVSISRAGYNTVAETLAARTPMVLVPFDAPNDHEQIARAARLEERGLARVLLEAGLTPELLAEAAAQARPPATPPRLDGAREAARILRRLMAERSARA